MQPQFWDIRTIHVEHSAIRIVLLESERSSFDTEPQDEVRSRRKVVTVRLDHHPELNRGIEGSSELEAQ
jgi:hypothetical protein